MFLDVNFPTGLHATSKNEVGSSLSDPRQTRPRSLALSVGLSILAASGCATTTYAHRAGDDRVGGVFQQPFKDVSWMREDPPEVLKHAVASPYILESTRECSAILNEISALDLVLGPDLDAPAEKKKGAFSADSVGLISSAIGGVVSLPCRGIVRKVSGAEQREKALADAIFAGMGRRAFLKGAARASNCLPPASLSPSPQSGPQPSPQPGAQPDLQSGPQPGPQAENH